MVDAVDLHIEEKKPSSKLTLFVILDSELLFSNFKRSKMKITIVYVVLNLVHLT